jgi:hypothetical protein
MGRCLVTLQLQKLMAWNPTLKLEVEAVKLFGYVGCGDNAAGQKPYPQGFVTYNIIP